MTTSKKELGKRCCDQCGKTYQPVTDRSHFCSTKCQQRSKYSKNPYNKETFGTGTTANKGRKQSPDHARKRAESVARSLANTVRECVRCGEKYTPTLAAQKYCSGRCWVSVSRLKKARKHVVRIHPEHYKVLFDLQGGKCGICGTDSGSNGRGDKLAVDHCHISGNIRGLLCHKCNTALGLLNDDRVRLKAAIHYLAESENRT